MKSNSAAVLLAVLFVVLLAGCQPGRSTPARVRAAGGALSFAQDGAAEVPATASAKTTTTAATVPPGVVVTAHPDGSISWTTAEPLRIETTVAEETATGPQSFAPPAPPSPADEADGRARWLAWVALVAGVAAGLFGLLKGWPMVGAGGGCVAAAAVAVLALSAVPPWVWTLGVVGVVLAAAGWALWRFCFRSRDLTGDSSIAELRRQVTV